MFTHDSNAQVNPVTKAVLLLVTLFGLAAIYSTSIVSNSKRTQDTIYTGDKLKIGFLRITIFPFSGRSLLFSTDENVDEAFINENDVYGGRQFFCLRYLVKLIIGMKTTEKVLSKRTCIESTRYVNEILF